jgi:hypothetical protein
MVSRRGANFTAAELDCFLDTIEEVMPLSATHWENIAATHLSRYPETGRNVAIFFSFNSAMIRRLSLCAPTYLSMSLPTVPNAARIILPPNEDTALFILQSVQKTGVHMPPGKWDTLVRLLWDSPLNQGPFYSVYREWAKSGSSRNIRVVVDALFCHYGD